ncbi:MAG TPA: hypothetical protein VKG84_05305 [Candidatus Acidoferrales bacterium]|nr:hypothetical protein [Candidatus Acidoferrales bacterium]
MGRPGLLEVRRGRVSLRYEPNALSREEALGFASLAARGIRAVERMAGKTGRARLHFEVRDAGHISTARGRNIFLPAQRVRTHAAPYLHEIAHALLPCRHGPAWFSEGLACYVESAVSERDGGYDSRLFTSGGNRGVDADARRWLAEARGRAVLPFVGRRGMPRQIVEDRQNVAAPFYVLSHSLVAFLAERAGFGALVQVARARAFAAAVRRATGKTCAAWRAEWLLGLKAGGGDGESITQKAKNSR